MQLSSRTKYVALALIAFGFIALTILLFPSSTVRHSTTPEVNNTTLNTPVSVALKVDRLQATLFHKGKIYGIEERSVYVSDDNGATFTEIGYLPRVNTANLGLKDKLKRIIAKSGVIRAYRRPVGPSTLIVLESGTVVVVSDKIYRKSVDQDDFEIVKTNFKFHAPFESGRSMAVGPDDSVYFGEYTKGPRKPKMRIIRGTDDGKSWEVAYTFPESLIYHVHSIAWDKYRQQFWISTGDRDSESHIFYTNDDFQTLNKIGGGSQDWRAVAFAITEDKLVWGSDDERAPSSIFSWNIDSNQLEKGAEIGNPASYVGALADGTLLVTTTYIPRTEFGQSDQALPEAALWASKDGSNWKKVFTLPAMHDLSGDKRPQFRLPGGDNTGSIAFLTPLYTIEHDFSTLALTFDWADSAK